MVSREELKKIVMLTYLTDDMLDKLMAIVDFLKFDKGEYVFKEGNAADRLYMLKRGKILLEQRLSDKVTVSVGAVRPGLSFGWSSMLYEDGKYTVDGISAEPSEVFSVRGEKMKKLLDEDNYMGYIIMQRLLRVVKNRLDHRTEQFLRAIKSQPEIQSLFIN